MVFMTPPDCWVSIVYLDYLEYLWVCRKAWAGLCMDMS